VGNYAARSFTSQEARWDRIWPIKLAPLLGGYLIDHMDHDDCC